MLSNRNKDLRELIDYVLDSERDNFLQALRDGDIQLPRRKLGIRSDGDHEKLMAYLLDNTDDDDLLHVVAASVPDHAYSRAVRLYRQTKNLSPTGVITDLDWRNIRAASTTDG